MKSICFISSTGGHLTQLSTIYKSFQKENFNIITEKNSTTKSLSNSYKVMYLFQQERKSWYFPFVFLINIFLSLFYVVKMRPKFIISTGAGSVIPFCIFGKLMGSKLIFIESFAKVNTPTLTGRILYKFADKFYVQWEDLLSVYKNAEFKGRLY